jgi:hypothetical protein
MFDARTTMSAFTKDPDLVYKIAFLQEVSIFAVLQRYRSIYHCHMKSILLTSLIVLATAGKNCKKSPSTALPACIEQRIEAIKKQEKWNPPAEVFEYNYKGKKVYYFSSNCCDQYNTVVDEQCNQICAPSGGLTGKGDQKCPDFKDSAQLVKLVWKDDR